MTTPTTSTLLPWRPRPGWMLVGAVAHPRDPDTALNRLSFIRHDQTGRYALDDGLSLRAVPQGWARQHDATRDPAAVSLGRRTIPPQHPEACMTRSTAHTVTFRAACGHERTETFHSRADDRVAHVAHQTAQLAAAACPTCRETAQSARTQGQPWARSGYTSEASYERARQFQAVAERGDRNRAAYLAAQLALPESQRAFRTRILDGCGTLDQLADESSEG